MPGAPAERGLGGICGVFDLREVYRGIWQHAGGAIDVCGRAARCGDGDVVARGAGGGVTAFGAVRETDARFAVDGGGLRTETVAALVKSAKEFFDAETTVNEALAAMDDAVRADD